MRLSSATIPGPPKKKQKKNTTHTHLATSPKRARELRKKMVLKIKTTQKNSLPHEKINIQRLKEWRATLVNVCFPFKTRECHPISNACVTDHQILFSKKIEIWDYVFFFNFYYSFIMLWVDQVSFRPLDGEENQNNKILKSVERTSVRWR